VLSRPASCWRGHRSFHLIRQPVALLFLPALPKSLLLVAINSRQLTNSTSAFTSGGILSEYEFRSRHSASQLSSPNPAPLNNVRITRSHFSLLRCSRCVNAAFRSSSLSARSIWLALFCAGDCDEVRTHNRIANSRRVIKAVSAWNVCGRSVEDAGDDAICEHVVVVIVRLSYGGLTRI
jgi:hypothetical protein